MTATWIWSPHLAIAPIAPIAPIVSKASPEEREGELQPLIMAQAVPNPPNDRKRVKVYELKNNDWFDRGTGFCVAAFLFVCTPTPSVPVAPLRRRAASNPLRPPPALAAGATPC